MKKSINARKKGHTFELSIVNDLKKLGFLCGTSRYLNRENDDKKIDITFTDGTPLNVQCKAFAKFPNPINILKEMEKFNPESPNFNVVAIKHTNKGSVAVLSLDDFYQILDILRTEGIFKQKK